MEKTTVSAHLTLVGNDFDLDYVTNILEISPTYTRDKNEILRNGEKFGHTEWGTYTEYEQSFDIEIQLDKVLIPYRNKVDLMNKIRIECNAEWNVVIVIYIRNGHKPALGFSKHNLKFLASIDADVGFDLYII